MINIGPFFVRCPPFPFTCIYRKKMETTPQSFEVKIKFMACRNNCTLNETKDKEFEWCLPRKEFEWAISFLKFLFILFAIQYCHTIWMGVNGDHDDSRNNFSNLFFIFYVLYARYYQYYNHHNFNYHYYYFFNHL